MPDPTIMVPHGLSPTAGTVLTVLVLAGVQISAYILRTLDNHRNGKSRDAIANVQVGKLDEIHGAVNGRLQEALDEIRILKAEVDELKVVARCPYLHEDQPKSQGSGSSDAPPRS